jgi:hypothetical protein
MTRQFGCYNGDCDCRFNQAVVQEIETPWKYSFLWMLLSKNTKINQKASHVIMAEYKVLGQIKHKL